MNYLKIKEDLYWIGALDPDLRIFDIIMYTPYGTTYNSYVIKGSEKTAIFETVKAEFFDDYIAKLKDVDVALEDLDYIIVNHTEPDHAGSLEKLLDFCPKAKVVGSFQAINFLKKITNREFNSIIVGDLDTLSLGNKTLKFISAPFLHWPDSMYTYIEEDNTLVTCDSFGSHYCFSKMFNDLIPNENEYFEALRYYFDNIMGPFKPYVLKAIDKIKDLKINCVCPGHGPILRSNPKAIIDLYKTWSAPNPCLIDSKPKVTICYVSAYGFTETLANKISEGIRSKNIEVKLYNVIKSDLNDILNDINESQGLLFGSPTIVSELLEPIRDILSKLNPVVHGDKLAAAFGSYGWSGEAVPRIESRLEELKMNVYGPGLKINFKPSSNEIEDAFNFGVSFSETLLGEKPIPHFSTSNEKYVELPCDGKTKYFKCLVCGEIFEGIVPPDICPVCGASSEQFVEVKRNISKQNPTSDKVIIIGNGAAGFYAAKTLREINPTCSIKMICKENIYSYYRPMLSDLISEDIVNDKFFLADYNWFKENNIEQLLNSSVTYIDKDNKFITLEDSSKIPYNKLILANGSHNFIPPINVSSIDSKCNIDKLSASNFKEIRGIFSIKALDDVMALKESIKTNKKAVLIGGGILGLEAAWELKSQNVDVTILEFAPKLLLNQLDNEGADIFNNIAKDSDLNILLGISASEVIVSNNKVSKVKLKNGETIDCDILIFSTGIRSNIDLAKNASIECNRGVIVDSNMKTNVDSIYACGDICELSGIVYGNWPAAIEMGKIAGENVAGLDTKFNGFVSSFILDAFNTKVFSAGSIDFNDNSLEQISYKDIKSSKYAKLFFKDDVLVGGILIGDISNSGKIILGIENGISKAFALSDNIL